ncbi:MAG: DUF2807 domain-containing protein [Chloroflexota bacterium]|nr:DUF2807 domain-containing protein [Chloroflexota bacterium]
MKKLSCLFILILISAILLTGCDIVNLFVKTVVGSGELVVEERDVTSFSKIDAGGNFELHVSKQYTGIEVNAESNLMKYIHTYVEGETLIVEISDTDGGSINLQPLEPIQVFVQFSKITGVSLSGGVQLASEALVAEDIQIDVNLSGGSVAKIDAIRTDKLNITLSGGSELNVSEGEVTEQIIEASGGSKYMAEWVQSEVTELRLSGGSEATIWAEETLDIDLSGGSTAYYYGSPNNLNETSNSGGSDYISKGER